MKLVALLLVLAVGLPVAQAGPRAPEPKGEVGLLAELEFGEGSSRLPEAWGSQLRRVAAWANENFDGLVVIDGHADARGREADNIRLSLRRARMVRDHLLALGVDPSQLIISAFGPEDRKRARVAVWGARTSLESVIANRKKAKRVIAPGDDRPAQARPSPSRRR